MEIKNFSCVFKNCRDVKAGSFMKDGQEVKYNASKKVVLGFIENGREVTLECKTDKDTFEDCAGLSPYQNVIVDLKVDFSSMYPKFVLTSIMEG